MTYTFHTGDDAKAYQDYLRNQEASSSSQTFDDFKKNWTQNGGQYVAPVSDYQKNLQAASDATFGQNWSRAGDAPPALTPQQQQAYLTASTQGYTGSAQDYENMLQQNAANQQDPAWQAQQQAIKDRWNNVGVGGSTPAQVTTASGAGTASNSDYTSQIAALQAQIQQLTSRSQDMGQRRNIGVGGYGQQYNNPYGQAPQWGNYNQQSSQYGGYGQFGMPQTPSYQSYAMQSPNFGQTNWGQGYNSGQSNYMNGPLSQMSWANQGQQYNPYQQQQYNPYSPYNQQNLGQQSYGSQPYIQWGDIWQ